MPNRILTSQRNVRNRPVQSGSVKYFKASASNVALSGAGVITFSSSASIRQSSDALESYPADHVKVAKMRFSSMATLDMIVFPVDEAEKFSMAFQTNIVMPPVVVGEDGYPV